MGKLKDVLMFVNSKLASNVSVFNQGLTSFFIFFMFYFSSQVNLILIE